jgi:hypothetical protein
MNTSTLGENESSGMGGSRSSKRRRNFVVIGTLAAVVLGGVLVAGVFPLGDRAGTAGSACALGGGEANTCVVGDTGPGGGIVFSVNESASAVLWRYLEAAPNTWSGESTDPKMNWDQAKSAASGYTGGGVSWYLPSEEELILLYEQRNVMGGFAKGYYWSSSQDDPYSAWLQSFANGSQNDGSKNNACHVRPIRAF